MYMDMDKYMDKERGCRGKTKLVASSGNAVLIPDNSQYTRLGKACYSAYAIKAKQRKKRYRPALPLVV